MLNAHANYNTDDRKELLQFIISFQTKDPIEFERKINCGQAEELIVQAENELMLARKMLNWKPWEPLVSKPPAGQWDWPPAQP